MLMCVSRLLIREVPRGGFHGDGVRSADEDQERQWHFSEPQVGGRSEESMTQQFSTCRQFF